MVEAEKLIGYSLMLIGIVFLLQAVGLIYGLITVQGFLEAASTMGASMGTTMPSFTTYIIAGWVYAILLLVTGLVSLIAGIACLVQK